jgi:hypothetical protein
MKLWDRGSGMSVEKKDKECIQNFDEKITWKISNSKSKKETGG